MIVDIFNIEKLIFENVNAKDLLWHEYSKFFKEYVFLNQIGSEQALLMNLYIKFLDELSKRKDDLLDKIFGCRVKIRYKFKKSVFNLIIKGLCKNKNIKEGYNKYAHLSNKKERHNKDNNLSSPPIISDVLSDYSSVETKICHFFARNNPSRIFKIYPNLAITRTKDELGCTFWK